MKEPYGYDLGNVYHGRMPDGSWLDFPTEGEYLEMFWENCSREQNHSTTQSS